MFTRRNMAIITMASNPESPRIFLLSANLTKNGDMVKHKL